MTRTASVVVIAEAAWLGGHTLHGPVAVVTSGDRIGWIGPVDEAPPGPRIAADGVLLPGLVDHHVHTELVDHAALLDGGLTTVVDLGAAPSAVFELARRSARAGSPGPRVLAAGPFLTAPGGYPTDRGWASAGMAWEVEGPAHADRAVRALSRHQPVTVKVALNSATNPVLDDDTLDAVVRAARACGITVTAHAEGPGQVARAVRAGVDRLAHAPWTEPLPDALLDTMARSVQVISTVDIHGRGASTPERERAIANLREFRRRGGMIRYGTDLGNGPLPVGVNGREIAALGEVGLSPHEVLHAITDGPIAAGARADLVTVEADPLADPARLITARVLLKSGSSPMAGENPAGKAGA